MILIVGSKDNAHVQRVLPYLTRDYVVVDTSWFPTSLNIDAEFARRAENLGLVLPCGKRIDVAEVGALWYRRVSPLEMHPDLTDRTSRLFAWSESTEALLGTWYSFNCFWMNPPAADETSQRKIRQLQVARQVGLSIPDTLITNRPEAAREFLGRYGPGKVIRKAFRNIEEAPRTTSVVTHDDLALLDSVRYAPVIFQEYVPADLDLRVTVIENEIFAARIKSEPEYHADYRIGLRSAEVEPYELPPEVAARLMELMRTFGLMYGAADFRVTPEGEHVFLEVNPAGEFLFISERTRQPIPEAIAATLEKHDAAHQAGRMNKAAARGLAVVSNGANGFHGSSGSGASNGDHTSAARPRRTRARR